MPFSCVSKAYFHQQFHCCHSCQMFSPLYQDVSFFLLLQTLQTLCKLPTLQPVFRDPSGTLLFHWGLTLCRSKKKFKWKNKNSDKWNCKDCYGQGRNHRICFNRLFPCKMQSVWISRVDDYPLVFCFRHVIENSWRGYIWFFPNFYTPNQYWQSMLITFWVKAKAQYPTWCCFQFTCCPQMHIR